MIAVLLPGEAMVSSVMQHARWTIVIMVARDGNGWSAHGITVNGNAAALQEKFGTGNTQAVSSPHTRDYVITW